MGSGRDAEETDGACADSVVGADATLVMGEIVGISYQCLDNHDGLDDYGENVLWLFHFLATLIRGKFDDDERGDYGDDDDNGVHPNSHKHFIP